jgi:dCTP deaminase
MSAHHTAVLSDRDIRREITAGNIILHDPNRDCSDNIQNCSVDVTLGPYFYRNDNQVPYYNPWNEKHVSDYWGYVKEASVVSSDWIADDLGLRIGDRYILIQPKETILGHTQEFIGGCNHITTMVKARSSLGRSNVTICRDAGWGDINFYNRWCLEISNNGNSPVVLPVGARIGQIIFFYTGEPDAVYSGKYQDGKDIHEIVEKWNPSMLLPRAYLDKSP